MVENVWRRRDWISASAAIALFWMATHVVGMAMTVHVSDRLGFNPVWFFDCVACSAPWASLPYGLKVIGGVSIPAVIAFVPAVVLVLRGRRTTTRLDVVLAALMGVALAAHVAFTWPVRYPGSLPPVLIGTLLPAMSVGFVAVGLATPARPAPVDPPVLEGWVGAVAGFLGAVGAMIALGGVASLVALGLVWFGYVRSRTLLQRVVVSVALVIAILSIVLRLMLRHSEPALFGWF